jgi:hypothetical protein
MNAKEREMSEHTDPNILEVIRTTRALVAEAAMTGFNCKEGDWVERLFANQAKLSDVIRMFTGSSR